MRLGGPAFAKADVPEAWVNAVKHAGYRAAYCPIGPEVDTQTVSAYAKAVTTVSLWRGAVGGRRS